MSIEQQTADYTRLTRLYGKLSLKKDGARHFENTRRASESEEEEGEDEASTGNLISEPWEGCEDPDTEATADEENEALGSVPLIASQGHNDESSTTRVGEDVHIEELGDRATEYADDLSGSNDSLEIKMELD